MYEIQANDSERMSKNQNLIWDGDGWSQKVLNMSSLCTLLMVCDWNTLRQWLDKIVDPFSSKVCSVSGISSAMCPFVSVNVFCCNGLGPIFASKGTLALWRQRAINSTTITWAKTLAFHHSLGWVWLTSCFCQALSKLARLSKDRVTAANCGVGIEDVKLSMGLEAAMAYLQLKIAHSQTHRVWIVSNCMNLCGSLFESILISEWFTKFHLDILFELQKKGWSSNSTWGPLGDLTHLHTFTPPKKKHLPRHLSAALAALAFAPRSVAVVGVDKASSRRCPHLQHNRALGRLLAPQFKQSLLIASWSPSGKSRYLDLEVNMYTEMFSLLEDP